jgi:hypothetical protein
MRNKQNPLERKVKFLLKVDLSAGEDACWIWKGGKNSTGYASFRFDGSVRHASRFSYRLFCGEIPHGLWVLHKCDNPVCVNPKHLFLGTVSDNHIDMVLKGRAAIGDKNGTRKNPECVKRGSLHYRAKLTESEVLQIRELAEKGMPHVKIAELFGLKWRHVGLIVRRDSWRHI